MAKKVQDKLLRDLADSFIIIANKHAETEDNNVVNTALMYASSRFSAYVAASSARNVEDFVEKQAQGIEFFTGEFTQMLKSNMKNYEKVFQPNEELKYAEYMKKPN